MLNNEKRSLLLLRQWLLTSKFLILRKASLAGRTGWVDVDCYVQRDRASHPNRILLRLMIAYFDLEKENKRRLDEMINSGRYNNAGEAINSAIEHLYQLDKRVQENQGLFIVDEKRDPETGKRASSEKNVQDERPSGREAHATPIAQDSGQDHTSGRGTSKARAETLSSESEIPEVLQKPGNTERPPGLATPATDRDIDGPVGPKEWVFGQHNRYLPLKASMRALSNLGVDKDGEFDPEDIADEISSYAADLYGHLNQIDERFGLKRGEKVSTAFPDSKKAKSKSRRRFAEQFVVDVGKSNGEYRGMPAEYRIITTDNPGHFQLREPGWEFATLENPVLDQTTDSRPDRLSTEEQEWLLDYIREHVPKEVYAFKTLLQAINEGADTPGELDDYLAQNIPGGDSISSSYLSSQRSGALARMADLSLIERRREGVHVRYVVTVDGGIFLEESASV